ISWNLGGSLATSFPVGDQQLNLIADYFFTDFQNQLVYDLDASADELRIYNLRGRSFAHSFQVEANYLLGENISLKGAYKYYDVNATIDGQLREVPFISTHRAFFNVEYATKYDKWKVDYTLHWYGSQRLPTTASNPEAFRRANRSPSYFHMNTQLSRGFRWGNIYLGAENLLGFTQDHPIIDAENPFGNEFDASIVWGPIVGRMVYAGLRFKIKN
ncbi:MAG: TonB-dependent receptor, partial [Bacteroidota bacterium]